MKTSTVFLGRSALVLALLASGPAALAQTVTITVTGLNPTSISVSGYHNLDDYGIYNPSATDFGGTVQAVIYRQGLYSGNAVASNRARVKYALTVAPGGSTSSPSGTQKTAVVSVQMSYSISALLHGEYYSTYGGSYGGAKADVTGIKASGSTGRAVTATAPSGLAFFDDGPRTASTPSTVL